MEARRRALAEAQIRDAEEAKRRAEDEVRRRREEEERLAREKEEAARRAAEEAARPPVEAEKTEEKVEAASPAVGERRAETRPQPGRAAPAATPAAPDGAALRGRRGTESEEDERRRSGAGAPRGKVVRPEPAKPAPRAKGDEGRRQGKLTLTTAAVDEDGSQRGRSLSAMRRRQEKFKRSQMQETREKISREVVLPETITIQELSQRMSERAVDVIKFLMKEGQMMKPAT